MGDTVAFRLDLEGPVILNPSASALPHSTAVSFLPTAPLGAPVFCFVFFF